MGKSGGWRIICNSTPDKMINLNQLGNVVVRQLKNTYQVSYLKDTHNFETVRSGLDNFTNRNVALPIKKLVTVIFSGGSRYIHDATSTTIVPRQIDVIIDNYRSGNLNK